MLKEYKIIAYSILAALSFWIIDALIDNLIHYEESFLYLLIHDEKEVAFRLLFSFCFLVFGILMARAFSRQKYAEEKLKEQRDHLHKKVEERTHDLQTVNEKLENEIAERKKMEAEVVRASNLASLGELAAGVAHEINNPVNGVINYGQILANKTLQGSKEHDIAKKIIKEGDRIASIVSSLLSFASDIREKKRPVTIREMLSNSLVLSEAKLKNDGINLKVNISPDLPSITAQPHQIEQVFLNILSNARYALNHKYSEPNENKTLEITAKEVNIESYPYVQITFCDKGIGISADILDKIMHPFFTTKAESTNVGLGMSISYGIISDHGGEIVVNSIEGEFTKVEIYLPTINQNSTGISHREQNKNTMLSK